MEKINTSEDYQVFKRYGDQMTLHEVIQQLRFDMDMITFDPLTGETRSVEQIKLYNEDNFKTYLADAVAIQVLQNYEKLLRTNEFNTKELNIMEDTKANVTAQVTLKDVDITINDRDLVESLCNRLGLSTRVLKSDCEIRDGVLGYWEDVGHHHSDYQWQPSKASTPEIVEKVGLLQKLSEILCCSFL